jgi:hypothetical protein
LFINKLPFSLSFAEAEVLEEIAYLKPHTTGKVAIHRWATSHLLQSYQLKEVTHLRRALKKRDLLLRGQGPQGGS